MAAVTDNNSMEATSATETMAESSLSDAMANLSISQSNDGQAQLGDNKEEVDVTQQETKISDPVDLISEAMDFISSSNVVPTGEGTVTASADSMTDTEVVTPAADSSVSKSLTNTGKGSAAYERLYAKGKEKNTQARLNAAQQKAQEASNPKRGPRPSSNMQSPNGLYERSLLQKKQREQMRQELEASEVPSFRPDRITKDKDKRNDGTTKAQDPSPVWERLHKQGELKKALAAQKAQEAAAKAEMEALKKPAGTGKTTLASGEIPRWQKLYEQGSSKRLAVVKSPTKATTPPRPNASAKAVSSGSRIDQLYRAGTNSNRRRSALPRDNRYRSDDEEVAAHCTFKPALVASQKKKHGSVAAGSSLASGSIAAQIKCDASLASSHAGNDSLIGRSLEVEIQPDTPTCISPPSELASPMDDTIDKKTSLPDGDIGTSATIESSQTSDAVEDAAGVPKELVTEKTTAAGEMVM